ncbi:DNA-lyase [Coniochaeta hoffmannii]|uniref:DNA-lyase n=1 Tax=Coniochaeta hoffmannii TaxID=91930 RepID=A0AA38S1M8_9PEZI|nr:DNA-lyase [Coniochaeta hoffmannii]
MSSPEPAITASKATRTTRTRASRVTNGAKHGKTAVATDEKVTSKTTVTSRTKAVAVKTEVEVEKKVVATKTKKRTANLAAQVKAEQDEDSELSELSDPSEPEAKPKPSSKKRKTKAKADPTSPNEDDETKPKKKRRTKAEKEAEEAMTLAARTATTALKRAMFVGAHVSAAGGVQNSIQNATKIGANAFALFLKSQRKWESPPLQAEHREEFHSRLKSHNYDAGKYILPHGSYLINLAQADKAKADQAYESFIDDLRRCEALGIRLYNFHPGSTGGDTMEAACGRIADQLNRAIRETKFVVPLLECYDLRTPEVFEETMRSFDDVVGIQYLKALHRAVNDSKAPFASHRDLHANIGTGFLGLQTFHNVMNYEPFQHLPMVLETPIEVKGPDGKMIEDKQIWADEIKLLESLIGMDTESEVFRTKSEALQAKGASERARIQEQVDKKVEKDAKKAESEAKKAAKKEAVATNGVKKKAAKKKPGLKKEESTLSSLSSPPSSCDSCGEESS